jgi:glutaredoxin 3
MLHDRGGGESLPIVTVYTTSYCAYCHIAKALLSKKGIPYVEVDVTGDDDMRRKLVVMSGGKRTVPQIWIGDKHVGGFTDLAALERRGELERLLAHP